MKKSIKLYTVLFLLLVIFTLTIYGVFYAIKNHNRSEIMTLDNIDIKRTISSDQLDTIKLPTVKLSLVYDKLPQTSGTITEINYKTFTKLFQTKGKSILILAKDGCAYCEEYLRVADELFNKLNINVYEINISKLDKKSSSDIFNYIDYDGTPTTYVIDNGTAKHTLTGLVDAETLNAFVDYFYTRNN